jgi:hypothetical protein
MLLDNTDWEVGNQKDPLQENKFARFTIQAEEKNDVKIAVRGDISHR